MPFIKRKNNKMEKEYIYKLVALREAIKLIPLAQFIDALIVIVMWIMYHHYFGNEFLWIPTLGTIIVAILWTLYSLHDCKVELQESNHIFLRHIVFACISAICTSVSLAICFNNVTETSQIFIVAVIMAAATSGALLLASFLPLVISWLFPIGVIITCVEFELDSRWSFLWAIALFVYFCMLTIECSVISKSFLERYLFIKKMESQNETILRLYEEEKQYNEKIKLYKNVLEQSPVSVVITDIDGKIEYVNPYFSKLTGYSFEEAKGQNPRILKTDKTEAKIFTELWEKLIHGEKWIGEFVNRKKNGDQYEESAIITPIRNIDNVTTHYVGIKENITDRKQKELELRNALVRAEEATIAKSQFLANMSHEIRTPMNAIIGMSYLTLRTELDDKQKDYVTKINTAATSLLRIINDILDFSKIEAGKLELEYTNFNLDVVVTETMGLAIQTGYEKGLEFLYHISPQIPKELIGDPLRLRQVITNLVSNAVKFTERGKVMIDVKALHLSDEKVKLQFSISDTGIGITEEEQTRLFQAFSQADNSTTRKFGGTGLGLAISSKLVLLMGGEIGVESIVNKGSTFSFTAWFNVADTSYEQFKVVSKELFNKKILIVDDSREAREILVEYLDAMKFQTDEASTGERAIELIKEADKREPYDIVIIDWKMQKMDGIEVAKRIEEDSRLLYAPKIIMITAFDKDELKKRAISIHLHDVMVKPISQSMLYDSIMNIYQNSNDKLLDTDSVQNKYKLNHLKILLVEDNEVNRQIGIELLESQGIVVDTAVNGQEAVQKIVNMSNEQPYHMILMDLQMPVMDGFEATRCIRERKSSIPIIAMTARTMFHERAECYEAGMNGHVAKPIDPNVLFSTIEQWVPATFNNKILLNDVTNSEKEKELHIVGVNVKAGIKRLAGNEKLYKEILIKYSETQTEIINKIEVALKEKDYLTVEKLAHTLKGVSGNIGAEDVQVLLEELECALKNPLYEMKINEIMERLVKIARVITQEIEEKVLFFDTRDI